MSTTLSAPRSRRARFAPSRSRCTRAGCSGPSGGKARAGTPCGCASPQATSFSTRAGTRSSRGLPSGDLPLQLAEPVENDVQPRRTRVRIRLNQQEPFAVGRDVELVQEPCVVLGDIQHFVTRADHEGSCRLDVNADQIPTDAIEQLPPVARPEGSGAAV